MTNWWTNPKRTRQHLLASGPREAATTDMAKARSVPAKRLVNEATTEKVPEHFRYPHHRLTTQEAAQYVRLSPRTLERLRGEATGPKYIRAGTGKRARVFYLIADLDAWLEGKRYQSTAEYSRY